MSRIALPRLRVLIVDDEPPARERLKRLLKDELDVEVVGEAGDGITALDQVDSLAPDVVLLDVQMPELDGLGVASAIARSSKGSGSSNSSNTNEAPAPRIIFTTAHDEHALKAFELAAIDYLLKPIAKERLRTALERVRATTPAAAAAAALPNLTLGPAKKMAVRSGAKFVVFATTDISAVLAQDHYAAIMVNGQELLSDDSLDTIMTRLDPATFLRVHRSAIINIDKLKELEQEGERKYVAILVTGERAPIARDRLDDVKKRLGI